MSTTTTFRPGGAVLTNRIVASRVTGSDGFAGQWRDAGYLERHANMTVRLESQTLQIGYPDAGELIDASLDGGDAPVHGPHAPEGVTWAVKGAEQREFFVVTKRNGKVLTQGSLELSKDGRVLTDSWWNPDEPATKSTLVYDKK